MGSCSACYFHDKRARGDISGYVAAPGLTRYSEPTAKVKAIIAAALEKEDE